MRHLATENTHDDKERKEEKSHFWAKSFLFYDLRVIIDKNREEVFTGLSANKDITLLDKTCHFSTQSIFHK